MVFPRIAADTGGGASNYLNVQDSEPLGRLIADQEVLSDYKSTSELEAALIDISQVLQSVNATNILKDGNLPGKELDLAYQIQSVTDDLRSFKTYLSHELQAQAAQTGSPVFNDFDNLIKTGDALYTQAQPALNAENTKRIETDLAQLKGVFLNGPQKAQLFFDAAGALSYLESGVFKSDKPFDPKLAQQVQGFNQQLTEFAQNNRDLINNAVAAHRKDRASVPAGEYASRGQYTEAEDAINHAQQVKQFIDGHKNGSARVFNEAVLKALYSKLPTGDISSKNTDKLTADFLNRTVYPLHKALYDLAAARENKDQSKIDTAIIKLRKQLPNIAASADKLNQAAKVAELPSSGWGPNADYEDNFSDNIASGARLYSALAKDATRLIDTRFADVPSFIEPDQNKFQAVSDAAGASFSASSGSYFRPSAAELYYALIDPKMRENVTWLVVDEATKTYHYFRLSNEFSARHRSILDRVVSSPDFQKADPGSTLAETQANKIGAIFAEAADLENTNQYGYGAYTPRQR